MADRGLIGTQRVQARVEAYHDGREPDGNPDEVVDVEVYLEADGTAITDKARIDAIRAAQENEEG